MNAYSNKWAFHNKLNYQWDYEWPTSCAISTATNSPEMLHMRWQIFRFSLHCITQLLELWDQAKQSRIVSTPVLMEMSWRWRWRWSKVQTSIWKYKKRRETLKTAPDLGSFLHLWVWGCWDVGFYCESVDKVCSLIIRLWGYKWIVCVVEDWLGKIFWDKDWMITH